MIKRGLKNYFLSLKYFFTPLGTLFLGVLFGLSIAIPLAISAAERLIEDFMSIAESINIDPYTFLNEISDRIKSLDWFNPLSALNTMLSAEWIKDTLVDTIYTLFTGEGEYAIYLNEFGDAISLAGDRLYAAFATLVSFTAAGAVCGFFLTKFLIRRTIAKRTLWKLLLGTLIDFLAAGSLFSVSLWLAKLWTPSLVISSLLAFLIFGGISLLKAYLVHGFKKVKIGEVVTFKNTGLLLVTNLTIFIISGVLVIIVLLIFNVLVGLVIALVLWQIASIVISLNAESYVKEYVDNKTAAAL